MRRVARCMVLAFALVGSCGRGASAQQKHIEADLPEKISLVPADVLRLSSTIDSLSWNTSSGMLAILTKSRDRPTKDSIILYGIDGKKQEVLYKTSKPIFSVTFSTDGSRLACGAWEVGRSGESAVLRWDSATREQSEPLFVPPLKGLGVDFTSDILCIAFSPDGRRIAAGTKLVEDGIHSGAHIGGEVCCWDSNTEKVLWSDRSTHTDIVYALAYSPDGTKLASAGYDKLVRIWSADTGKLERTLFGGGWFGAASVCFSDDAALLATGGNGLEEGGQMRVWDVHSGELKYTIPRSQTGFQRETATRVVFSKEGSSLFAIGPVDAQSPTWQLQKWQLKSRPSKQVLYEGDGAARAIARTKEGDRLAIGTWEGEVLLFELEE